MSRFSWCEQASATPRKALHEVLSAGSWRALQDKTIFVPRDTIPLAPSIFSTRHFQRSLPRLPIPLFNKALFEYAAAVKPLLPPAQYKRTGELLKQFESNEGYKLHKELVRMDRANPHTSFISSDLLEHKLRMRDPLPVRHHRCIFMRPHMTNMDFLMRATHWIRNSVVFYKLYLDNTLCPDIFYADSTRDVYYKKDWFQQTVALCPEYFRSIFMTVLSRHKAFPLDLSRYDNLFNSTRVPGAIQDEIHAVGFMPHIIVQYRGHQFVMKVATEKCDPLSEEQILARLRAIVGTKVCPPRVDVGVFTSLPRAEWNGVRTELLRDVVNRASFDELESSMFVLNLDDDALVGSGDFTVAPIQAARLQMTKTTNRWWDKSFSLNMDSDGSLSVSYEDSWGGDSVVRRYVEDVWARCALRSTGPPIRSDVAPSETLRQLHWRIPTNLEEVASRARIRLEREAAQLDVYPCILDNIPAPPAAAFSLSSALHLDALVQLSAQVAWWRLHGSTVSSVQPVHLGMFCRGQRDFIQTASEASQIFTIAAAAEKANMGSASLSVARLGLEALKQYCKTAHLVSLGNGIYNYLFALSNMSQRLYGRTPALFLDEAYSIFCEPTLVAEPYCSPVAVAVTATPPKRGYGVTYTLVGDALVLLVSGLKGLDGPHSSAAEYANALMQSAKELYVMLLEQKT